MDKAIYTATVQAHYNELFIQHGFHQASYSGIDDLIYRHSVAGWYLFMRFQYNNEFEILPYREFFIQMLRVTKDHPYGLSAYNDDGTYIPGSINRRIINYGVVDSWQYGSIAELEHLLTWIRPHIEHAVQHLQHLP